MPLGPGKYDELCLKVRQEAEAEAVLLLVFNGKLGQGFSVQAPLGVTLALPGILRIVADEIESDVRATVNAMGNQPGA